MILEDWPIQSGPSLLGLATYIEHVDAHLIHHLGLGWHGHGLLVGRHGVCMVASFDACMLSCLLIGCAF